MSLLLDTVLLGRRVRISVPTVYEEELSLPAPAYAEQSTIIKRAAAFGSIGDGPSSGSMVSDDAAS
jgi:hypothetical protein